MEFAKNILPPFMSKFLLDASPQLIPYAILCINFIIFKLLRSCLDKLFVYLLTDDSNIKVRPSYHNGKEEKNVKLSKTNGAKLVKVFVNELLSTSELCADCAELNVVYEMHGTFAYGISLFLLTILWVDAFGDAHTTPGYLVEEYFMQNKGNRLLWESSTYARFLGQSLAMPLAWRFAASYWQYQLIQAHTDLLKVENCKSALSTSTWIGFSVEFACSLLCRLMELGSQSLFVKRYLNQRLSIVINSFVSSLLVVLALEISGGYFNPILAACLEFGCRGADLKQHTLVFWAAPLLGHLVARSLHCYLQNEDQLTSLIKSSRVIRNEQSQKQFDQSADRKMSNKTNADQRRITRSSSNRKKRTEQQTR